MKTWNPEKSSCLCRELYMYTRWKLNIGDAANERGRELWALPNAMRSPRKVSQCSSREGLRSREITRTAAEVLVEERGGTSTARGRQAKAHRYQDPRDHVTEVCKRNLQAWDFQARFEERKKRAKESK